MSLLKSIYFLFIFTLLTLFHAFLVWLLNLACFFLRKPFPTDSGHKIAISWGRLIMVLTPGWKVEITGKEHLPPAGTPYVLVANHESTADIFVIYLLGIQFKWIAKYELFKIPILGFCMHKLGYIPIKRGDTMAHREALKRCEEWIHKGFSVLFFPEGTRSTEGRPKTFKVGAFKIARENQTPLLPIVLSGAGKLLKKGTVSPNSATVKIKILPPVLPNENESIEDLTARVQALVVDEHAKLTADLK